MYTVIVRRTSHRSDTEHEPIITQVWTRAFGKDRDGMDEAQLQKTADTINSLAAVDTGDGFCRHLESRVAIADAAFKAPRPEVRTMLEQAGIAIHDPGPAGRMAS